MPVIETALTRLLDIEHPILLAPMGLGCRRRPRGCWIPPPPAIRWARCWGSAASPPRRSMPRSTGWAASSRSSRPSWSVATSRMARCCSTTLPPPPLSRGQALPRRTLLRTGPAWLQPRPPGRPAADCHWPDVRRRRLPGRRRGVRGQYRRSADLVVADREAEAALQAAARGDGGRPRRADQRAPRADIAPGWPRLDHCTAGAGDQAAGRRRRAVAALAV